MTMVQMYKENLHLPKQGMTARLSLDLSLSPSNEDANELAGAFSCDESETDPEMEAACELVQILLDQVAWNDAPPTNEEVSKVSVVKKSNAPRDFSRQCHVQPLSPSFASLQRAPTESDDSTDRWKAHYNIRCTPSERKMGHVALATLCARTLESVGKPSLPTKEVRSQNTKASFQKNIQPPKGKIWIKHQSPKMQWLRQKSKKGYLVAQSPNINRNMGLVSEAKSTFFREDEEREGVNHVTRDSSSERENIKPNRLQMFGSEYARYLSTTVLAPKEAGSKGSSAASRSVNSRRLSSTKVQKIEDAEQSVLTGAITDLVVTYGEESPPKGFYRISQSAGGETFFLRDHKTPAYLNVKKERNWDRAAQRPCVTALALIYPERKEFVPPGFSVVLRHNSIPKKGVRSPANLSCGDEAVFLCFRRSREGNPITGILPLHPAKREAIPEGYTVLERTPRNFVAKIQTTGSQVFLAYRQRLANLELLRPLPLVMSVHNSSSRAKRLTAYYCTGGTVVQSRVGRFHIMDRSTHSLLSPSSISNRLSLIEASRRKTSNSMSDLPSGTGDAYSYSGGSSQPHQNYIEILTSSILLAPGLGSSGSRSVVSELEKLSSKGDYQSVASSLLYQEHDTSMNRSVNQSVSSVSNVTDDISFDTTNRSVYTTEDKELQRCLDTLSFIPVVSTALDENDPRGLLRFQARVAILTPVLTACYTRHGGAALLAVEGLTNLLHNNFFLSDINLEEDASSRITLLDIVVQVVCDVAMTGAQETHLQACVEFVEAAVKYGCGHLNTRTVGYVLRFYFFVFYFGVSSASGAWGLLKGRDHSMLDDPRVTGLKYLPGGASQSATLSLKDLITFSVARLKYFTSTDRVIREAERSTSENKDKSSCELFNIFIDELVDEVVNVSVHRVDIANFTQLAMHQIHRSGGSELFWYDMINTCGHGLFGNDLSLREETRNMYAICFALLANCVKVASAKMRKDKNSEAIPRDLSSKLMTLEMLKFFLEKWVEVEDEMQVPGSDSFVTFAFCVRRLVIPCLLSNTKEAQEDPRVYRRVIRIIGSLICSPVYRVHMKLELGILIEHFVLKVFRLGPQILCKTPKGIDMIYLFAQQIELMKEIKKWFACDARNLLELFLNFDNDSGTEKVGSTSELLSGIEWKISEQICASLCSVSEKCGDFIAEQIKESQSMSSITSLKAGMEVDEILNGLSGMTLARESAIRLRNAAIDAISQIVRGLAEYVAMAKGQQFYNLVHSWAVADGNTTHSGDVTGKMNEPIENYTSDDSSSESTVSEDVGNGNLAILGYWQEAISKKVIEAKKNTTKVKWKNSENFSSTVYSGYQRLVENERKSSQTDHLGIAFDIAREKSLSKAIDYLVACNILTPSPRDIASFLRIHRADLKPTDLGRYLGEGGTDGSDLEYWNLVRFCYIRAISFVGMTVEQGLRHLLTNGGFRLPGEAQQVDRLITTFAQCYWEDNAGDQAKCPFLDQDTVFFICFAIIMLNTDLHKSVPTTKTGAKKHQQKKMTKSEFLDNLRGVVNAKELNQEYLAEIYDSIEVFPIVLHDGDTGGVASIPEENLIADLNSMVDNAKNADALLRGLSIHEYRFITLDDYRDTIEKSGDEATCDVARHFLLKAWHQFHGLINAALSTAHLDLMGMESCVLLLKYAICLTVCLDMPMECRAFLGQLGRFRLFNAWRRGEATGRSFDQATDEQEEWYASIEKSCTKPGNRKSKLKSIEKLGELVSDLGLNIAVDVEGRKAIRDAVRSIQNAEFLVNDPTRNFLRQGDLLKRANRSGRCTEYRFFLFSDTLIYAKKIPGTNQYKIHEELPLILMKVVDWFPSEMQKEAKRAIQIYHPKKTFIVLCSSSDERKSWATDIRYAIDRELKRKVSIEAARKAAGRAH